MHWLWSFVCFINLRKIANYISQYVVDFIKNQQKSFANKTKEFVLERMNLAKVDLEKSEVKLTEFRKVNPLALDTPDLQLIRARYMRDVKVNQQIFITLREQLEIAKIESNKERLYINILDNAYPNPSKEKPKTIVELEDNIKPASPASPPKALVIVAT